MSPRAGDVHPRRCVGSATRLAGFLAFMLAAVLAASTFVTVHWFDHQSLAATNRNMAAELESFQHTLSSRGESAIATATVAYLQGRVLPRGEVIMVGLNGGGRFGSTDSAPLLHTGAVQRLLTHPPKSTRSERALLAGTNTLFVAAPMMAGDRTIGTVIVATDLAQQQSDQNRVLALVIGLAFIALVGAVTGAYLLLRRLLRTVGRITTTASAIESGDLDRRLGDQGTDDEVGQLAATFDSMLDRLDTAMTVQRRLLSDVSHQLRTPLTVARGHLEVLARQDDADIAGGARHGHGRHRRARPHAIARRATPPAGPGTGARLSAVGEARPADLPVGPLRRGSGPCRA